MKSGIKTSEFWITLVPVIVGLLMSFGTITPEDQDVIISLGTQVIGGVVALFSLINYVNGRVELKKMEVQPDINISVESPEPQEKTDIEETETTIG